MFSVFATIAAWVKNIGLAIGMWFRALFNWLFLVFKSFWGVCLIMTACLMVALKDIELTMAALYTMIGTVGQAGQSLAAPGGFAYWFALANTFSPMDELFGYLNIYLHLACGFGVYKLIKSWIPTVSGS